MGNKYLDTCLGPGCGFNFASTVWPTTCPRCRTQRSEKEARDGGEKKETQKVETDVPSV